MNKTRQVFDAKQNQVSVCASGRIMVCLNAEVVKTTEQVAVGMSEDGTMEYEDKEKTQYAYDVYWLDGGAASPLAAAKEQVLEEIGVYDNSPAVNAFILNGNLVSWSSDDPKSPNKSVRMGLRQNISDKQTKGEENITMWLGGMPITLKCEEAEALMCNLEDYAYECFNVTAAHKKAVSELETVEEVLTYDYKQGYPSKLEINI